MSRDKAHIRASLAAEPHRINFAADVFTLSHTQRSALSDAAKACGYRKSISSSLSLGGAFFVYLARDLNVSPMSTPRTPGRWSNDGLARG